MTREEIKDIVRHVFHFYEVNAENCNWTDMNEACGEIIKVLRQKPCEDCISRQAVLALAKEECETAIIPYRRFVKDINALPSVAPQPKTGHWNSWFTEIKGNDTFNCMECGSTFIVEQGADDMNYCPNCGTKMVESEEV